MKGCFLLSRRLFFFFFSPTPYQLPSDLLISERRKPSPLAAESVTSSLFSSCLCFFLPSPLPSRFGPACSPSPSYLWLIASGYLGVLLLNHTSSFSPLNQPLPRHLVESAISGARRHSPAPISPSRFSFSFSKPVVALQATNVCERRWTASMETPLYTHTFFSPLAFLPFVSMELRPNRGQCVRPR